MALKSVKRMALLLVIFKLEYNNNRHDEYLKQYR